MQKVRLCGCVKPMIHTILCSRTSSFLSKLPFIEKNLTMADSPPTEPPTVPKLPETAQNASQAPSTTATASIPAPNNLKTPQIQNATLDSDNHPPEFINILPEESPRRRNLNNLLSNEKKFEEGYDSDGDIGPFFDCIEYEGEQDFDEDDLFLDSKNDEVQPTTGDGDGENHQHNNQQTESNTSSLPTTLDSTATTSKNPPEASMESLQIPVFVDIDFEELKSFNVEKLKVEIRKRGGKLTGNKGELQKRLKKMILDKVKVDPSKQPKKRNKTVGISKSGGGDERRSKKKKTGIASFPDGVKWRELTPNSDAVLEPDNPSFKTPHAPTIDPADASSVPVKHNFSETFTRPEFGGTVEQPQKYANGVFKKNKDGITKTETVPRKDGCLNPKFVEKYNLSKLSRPDEYADILLPLKKNVHGKKEYLSFTQICKWTNLKASLSGAGDEEGGNSNPYPDFKPFTPSEIRKHVGIYVLQGLNPSPRVEWKFAPQRRDKVHGNDFVYRSFGTAAERRHRHFKSFFALQDPAIEIPDRRKYPNWKVRPLIQWLNFIMPFIWMLGFAFSIDEMTMGFKGRHQDKKRITYKAEGDGFQADALCDEGFTYQIFMRNDPAPSQYLNEGLSPLHSRVMALFDTVKDEYHRCAMDNLYNSAVFCRAAFNHKNKVLAHGVTRKGHRGLPSCVIQKEVISRAEQITVRGTVKAAVLEGDPNCPQLIASSVYDTKPVHYLSMTSTELKWVEVKKPVYNVDSGKIEKLSFLRMNHIDAYNREMGNVDVADQLRGNYRFDHWLRNRKWWWSIFFWGLGVVLTNAYIIYKKVNQAEGVEKKNFLSQHEKSRKE